MSPLKMIHPFVNDVTVTNFIPEPGKKVNIYNIKGANIKRIFSVRKSTTFQMRVFQPGELNSLYHQ